MTEMDCWKLLENDDFVHWVLHPDEVADKYWEAWMLQDPEHISLVEQAREVLQQLQVLPVNKKDKAALSHEIWEGIQRELHSGQQTLILPVGSSSRLGNSSRRWWAVAASVLILVSAGAGIWYTSSRNTPPPLSLSEAIAVSPVAGKGLIQCRNQSNKPQRIYLVDGSIVTLEPVETPSLRLPATPNVPSSSARVISSPRYWEPVSGRTPTPARKTFMSP